MVQKKAKPVSLPVTVPPEFITSALRNHASRIFSQCDAGVRIDAVNRLVEAVPGITLLQTRALADDLMTVQLDSRGLFILVAAKSKKAGA